MNKFKNHQKIYVFSAVLIVTQLILIIFNLNVFNALLTDIKKNNQSNDLGMLSQQLTKSIFTLQAEHINNLPKQSSLAQIAEATESFNSLINELITEYNNKQKNTIFSKNNGELVRKIDKIQKEWLSWREGLELVLMNKGANLSDIDYSLNKLTSKNVYLLNLTEDLSISIKSDADDAVVLIKRLQVFIFIFFLICVYWFMKIYINQSNEENQRLNYQSWMLGSLNDSILLLDSKGDLVKNQAYTEDPSLKMSMSLGGSLASIFQPYLNEFQVKELHKFANVLLNASFDLAALNKLNPLKSVKATKYGNPIVLQATFTQIVKLNKIEAIMVKISVIDSPNDEPFKFTQTVFRKTVSLQ